MIKLKPCPFCGRHALQRDGYPLALIICEDEVGCGGRTMGKTIAAAAELWNRRTAVPEEAAPFQAVGYVTPNGDVKWEPNKDPGNLSPGQLVYVSHLAKRHDMNNGQQKSSATGAGE